jgi:hypothetical protein
MENSDAGSGVFGVFGKMPAPGFFLAFPVSHYHHCQFRFEKS